MPDVIGAFGGGVQTDRRGDQVADLIKVARACGAHEGFEFREGELDRIEVRTVGRQKSELRADVVNQCADLRLFMDGEIVEHDNVAGPQRGCQNLFDVGEETRVIDRPVKDGGRGQSVEPEPCDHRVRLPMAARGVIAHADAAKTAAVPPEQIGRHPTFVKKHVLPHVAQRLPGAPPPPLGHDIRPALFVGVYGFF